MVARSARVEWLDADKAQLVEIKPIHEHVDRANGVVLGHVVVEHRREQCALPAIDPFHEPRHRSLLPPTHWRIIAETAEAEFSHKLGPNRPPRLSPVESASWGEAAFTARDRLHGSWPKSEVLDFYRNVRLLG
jgi:hypothetical protein